MEKRACFGAKPKSYSKLQNIKRGGKSMAQLLTVKDVEKICQVKQGKAYRLMKEINDEMKEKGYIVIRGRVNSKFLYEKLGLGDKNGQH